MVKFKPKPNATPATRQFPRALQLTTILLVVAGFLFVRPYIGTILFSALISFVFNPVYKYIYRKTKRNGIAISSTIIVAMLALILPLLLVVTVTFGQVNSIITQYRNGSLSIGPDQVQMIVDRGVDRVETVVSALPAGSPAHVSKKELSTNIKNAIINGLQSIGQVIANFGLAFFDLIGLLILAIFLISSMLRYQTELIDLLRRLSPFDNSINNVYLDRVAIMTKAMVKGQFIIAAFQGFASTVSLWLMGVDFFWFFFMLLAFLSFIPLGAGIVTIPIGIVFILTGHWWQGLFIILWHMVVVSSIDNILRPHLVPKTARLNTALMLLAVFSGIAIFGLPGVIYGPVFMILIVTTLKVYAEYNVAVERVGLPAGTSVTTEQKPSSKRRRLWPRLRRR